MIKRLYTVKWVLKGYQKPEGGGRENNPDWHFILEKLDKLRHDDGTVTLKLILKNSEGKELSVYAKNDHYSIIFNDIDADGDILRTSYNREAKKGLHEMHGLDWDARTIFTDYDAVYDIFKQFFETGEVSSSPILPGGP